MALTDRGCPPRRSWRKEGNLPGERAWAKGQKQERERERETL